MAPRRCLECTQRIRCGLGTGESLSEVGDDADGGNSDIKKPEESCFLPTADIIWYRDRAPTTHISINQVFLQVPHRAGIQPQPSRLL